MRQLTDRADLGLDAVDKANVPVAYKEVGLVRVVPRSRRSSNWSINDVTC